MALALALMQLINAATPGIAQLILLIRSANGSISIMPMLNQADADFTANIKQATDWLNANPPKPVV